MREVIFFHGADCPHCKVMRPIVAKLEKELGVKVKKLEVWNNESNADKMRKFSKIIRATSNEGGIAVPAFVDIENKEALVGEQTRGELRKWLMEK